MAYEVQVAVECADAAILLRRPRHKFVSQARVQGQARRRVDVILKVQTSDRVAETPVRIIVAVKDRTPEPAVGVANQKIVNACESILRRVARRIAAVELNAVDVDSPFHRIAAFCQSYIVDELKRVEDLSLSGVSPSDVARPIRDGYGTHLRHVGHKVQ